MGMFRRKAESRAIFRPFPLKEETGCLLNPYRGFYVICRLYANSLILEEKNIPVTQFLPPPEHTMVLLEINLQHFREGDLSREALENIRTTFEHFASHGFSMILRFTYDWIGQGAMSEPAALSVILQHMGQLSPLLMAYGPHIYILQGLFIGSWGEMHNTRYAAQSYLITLAEHLAACSSPHTFLSVRCPSQWRTIFRCYSPLSFADVQRSGLRARVGLFNDAILGSETDMGTYGTLSRSASVAYTDKLNRYDEILFQTQLCRYVPNGGEVLHASALNDFKPALRTMAAMRLSYLNSNYDRSVLDKWARGHSGTGAFRKLSDLAYIEAHLGYRYELLKRDVLFSQERCYARCSIANKGFSPCYRPMEVHLVLCDEQGECVVEQKVDTDIRTWLPEAPVHIACEFDLPARRPGRLLVGLRLREPITGREIRLCNTPPLPFLTNPIGEIL